MKVLLLSCISLKAEVILKASQKQALSVFLFKGIRLKP